MSDCGGYDTNSVISEFYDHVVPYRERDDINFFVDYASKANGPVLEIGCGTGRILIPTAEAVYEIVGMDLSDHMLNVCKKRVAELSPEVNSRISLIKNDMRSFDLEREFGLITLPFRPFQHLTTVEDQISCLKTIHKHLKPGGRLILDLFNPSMKFLVDENAFKESGDEPGFEMPDGRKVTRRIRIAKRDLFNQVSDCELIYYIKHPDGHEEKAIHEFKMRYLFRYEAEHLLVRCGFEVENLFAGYDRSEFGSKDPGELVFVATKR